MELYTISSLPDRKYKILQLVWGVGCVDNKVIEDRAKESKKDNSINNESKKNKSEKEENKKSEILTQEEINSLLITLPIARSISEIIDASISDTTIAIDNMVLNAQKIDADAIIDVRFVSHHVNSGTTIIASGTAVKYLV